MFGIGMKSTLWTSGSFAGAALRAGCPTGLILVFCACGGEKEEPQTAQQPYQQQPYGYGGQYQQQPQQQQPPPQQTAAAGGPGSALPPTAQPGTPAQKLDPAAGAAATQVLVGIANSEAPGAKPLGSAIVGNFQQGQSLEETIQMQPGKCYTIVGAGVPPVSELNIQLAGVMPIPGMSPILAQDQDTGAQAVLGRKPNCYKYPFPVGAPAKVIITVAGGSGLAAAQVYEK